jgi:hypothetical protein
MIKLLVILSIFLLSCEYEDNCKNGQKQKIDEVCYECVSGEMEIIDCAEWGND